MNIRARLALTAALSSALAVLVVAAALFLAVDRFLTGAQKDRVYAASKKMHLCQARGGPWGGSGAPPGGEPGSWSLPQSSRGVEVRLVVAGRAPMSSPDFPAVPLDLSPGWHEFEGRLVLVKLVSDNCGSAVLAVASPGLDEPRRAFGRALATTLPLAVLLVAAAGWFTAGRLLGPLRALEVSAREIGASGDLTRPLPGAGQPDELGRLAGTLQSSLLAIAATREREAEFTRAAAHDLRAPLTAMQSRIQAALARPREAGHYRRELAEVGHDVSRLSRLTAHLLLLARDPASLVFGPLSLAAVAAGAVDRAREAAPDTWVDLELGQAEAAGFEMRGDAVLLGQLADNLLQNALRHAPGAGVTVRLERAGQRLRLIVADDGPGVAPAVLEKLGRPFYRPDDARSGDGSGLGLAIARRVAELHGGSLRLSSEPGRGLTAAAEFPA